MQRKTYPFSDDELLHDLSASLRLELALYVNREIVDKVPFFHGRDPAFIRSVIMRLKPIIFAPGDHVVVENDVGNAMYFVKKGVLEVCSGDGSTLYATLEAGSFFGEVGL